ncbi:PIN domain nuclease [Streptomyces roseicoloratus]|uniref:Ribonuclease VapC n=1 Tax=Streptomyces roseicoloratus TaxID=2508722 RepID=A0ABY9RXK1_9ACTN|nr:PIN domain nuclease [Streptomyces roseicoloratus]WMX46915.1 PIN domain nuclease [Streptomyces roseicoloratus]
MNVATYLVDTSAAVRIIARKHVQDEWRKFTTEGVVALCDITELEILYSARSAPDRLAKEQLLERLFTWTAVPDGVYSRARRVQEMLTERGEHRSAGPVDLMVAATAELSGLTLLHYDRDFDVIARVTGQPMRWVAPPGTA